MQINRAYVIMRSLDYATCHEGYDGCWYSYIKEHARAIYLQEDDKPFNPGLGGGGCYKKYKTTGLSSNNYEELAALKEKGYKATDITKKYLRSYLSLVEQSDRPYQRKDDSELPEDGVVGY